MLSLAWPAPGCGPRCPCLELSRVCNEGENLSLESHFPHVSGYLILISVPAFLGVSFTSSALTYSLAPVTVLLIVLQPINVTLWRWKKMFRCALIRKRVMMRVPVLAFCRCDKIPGINVERTGLFWLVSQRFLPCSLGPLAFSRMVGGST